MNKIWKYTLDIGAERQSTRMPEGYRILAVRTRTRVPLGESPHVMWALVDPASPMVDVTVAMYASGQDIHRQPGNYIGTVYEGALALHVFEVQ